MTRTLPDWLADSGLSRVWQTVADGLERRSLRPAGVVVVRALTRRERHALGAVLGRPLVQESVRLDLADLDALVRERSGVGGLRQVAELAVGHPLRDRAADRSATVAAREAPYRAARDWLDEHVSVAGQEWPELWLTALRRTGLLSRTADPAATIVLALQILADRLGPAPPSVARTDLAARFASNAHALDDSEHLAQLVLRGLAVADGVEPPVSAHERRIVWERHAVRADNVSSTCLTLGIRPLGDDARQHRLAAAAELGDPVHLTAWDVQRTELTVAAGTSVLVCENPRVLEAFAELRGGSVPVVCVAGEPGLVALDVLRALNDGGAVLHYHGDFDWAGIAIANRLLRNAGVRPWRMSVADYRRAVRLDGPPLQAHEVCAEWDPELSEAMRQAGVAVHEEAVLDTLLDFG